MADVSSDLLPGDAIPGDVTSGDGMLGDVMGDVETPCLPLDAVPRTAVSQYVPVQAHTNACDASQINAYLSACTSPSATHAGCVAWFQTKDNFSCGSCINPVNDAGTPTSQGALLIDGNGLPWPNLPGCVAVADGNPTCATVLSQFLDCAFFACSSCSGKSQTALDNCLIATQGGACYRYFLPVMTPCQSQFAQGGSAISMPCNDGDPFSVTNVVCGTGP
jgi:hypothetical protein